MGKKANTIDLVKMGFYILKRIWLVILCAAIGFGAYYYYTANVQKDTYTVSGTMYVYNGNPNVVNYQYTNASDLNSAVKLMETYMVVIKSNKVMDVVCERLADTYPNITPSFIAGSLSMGSVSETGVLRVRCTTRDAQMSTDICNAVMDVAPAEIIRVVSAGSIEIIDYAVKPSGPDSRGAMRKGLMGALAGAAAACVLLAVLFLLNRRIGDTKELTDTYTPPVLSSIPRSKGDSDDPSRFLLHSDAKADVLESYAKLRMNMLFTLVNKEHHIVEITSAISGEGKSTISANLAIVCALSGKHVLLVDADLRRASQRDIFGYDKKLQGLSDILVGNTAWQNAVLQTQWENMDILAAGQLPPNPAELMSSGEMHRLLEELSAHYELILIDAPPVNIVSDPLVLSSSVAGCLFVVRQNYSDHREVQKALTAAEMTGMDVLGFVFYGENLNSSGYYYKKHYSRYYNQYYHRDHREKEQKPETDRS